VLVELAVLELLVEELSVFELLASGDFDSPSLDELPLPLRPLLEDEDERESVMYQPLPLKTMPTGWMTLRKAPPHCSQVVSGGSEKLCRFSMRSLQAVQV
jgi:hypothetical protein